MAKSQPYTGDAIAAGGGFEFVDAFPAVALARDGVGYIFNSNHRDVRVLGTETIPTVPAVPASTTSTAVVHNRDFGGGYSWDGNQASNIPTNAANAGRIFYQTTLQELRVVSLNGFAQGGAEIRNLIGIQWMHDQWGPDAPSVPNQNVTGAARYANAQAAFAAFFDSNVYDPDTEYWYFNTANNRVEQIASHTPEVPATPERDVPALIPISAFLGLGPEQNVFGDDTTANRAAARAILDAYTADAANSAWLSSYNANRDFLVQLMWADGTVILRRNIGGTDWEDAVSIISGQRGRPGPPGVSIVTQAEWDALRARVATLEGYHRQPTAMEMYYFGWSDDRLIDTSDFANFAESMTFEGDLPSRNTDGYIVAAVPEPEGVPTEIYIAGGANSIDGYTRQAGTVNDANGDPHIVLVSNDLIPSLFAGSDIRLGFE